MINPQPATTLRRNRVPTKPTQAPFTPEQIAMLRAPPTHYDPAFADAVVEILSKGYSLGGFAGKIGVGRNTINQWLEKHPEFNEACARATSVRQLYWEDKAIYIAETGGQGSQGQMVMFGLLNAGREDWKNKQEIEHTGQITLSSVVEASMKAIEARTIDHDPQEVSASLASPNKIIDAF